MNLIKHSNPLRRISKMKDPIPSTSSAEIKDKAYFLGKKKKKDKQVKKSLKDNEMEKTSNNCSIKSKSFLSKTNSKIRSSSELKVIKQSGVTTNKGERSLDDQKEILDAFKQKTKEFLNQIKTKRNFITMQKQIKNNLVDLSFKKLFKKNSIDENTQTTEENSKTFSPENFEETKERHNSKSIHDIKNSELTEFSYFNPYFLDELSDSMRKRTKILSEFIREKSLKLKEPSVDLIELNKLVKLSFIGNLSSISQYKLSPQIDVKNKSLNNKLITKQIKLVETSKLNLNKPYFNDFLYDQEKDDPIEEYECIFEKCEMKFKNKIEWDKHYSLHCRNSMD